MDPEGTTKELRDVTRSWFHMLLRYTFRTKLRDGWKTPSPAFDLADFDDEQFTSQLDEKQVRSLVRRTNLFNEYKETYKVTKGRIGWTRFCIRIKSFTQLVGLQTDSIKAEQILQELEKGLPELKNARMLQSQSLLIERLKADARSERELREKIAADAASVNTLREQFESKKAESERQLRLQLETKKAESERLLRKQLEAKGAEAERKLRKQLEAKTAEAERRLREQLEAKTAESERALHERLAANAESERKLRENLQAKSDAEQRLRENLEAKSDAERKHRIHDSLVSCRELMEKLVGGELPAARQGNFKGQQYKQRWKDLFHTQWTNCKAKKPAGHPLVGLVAQQKYYVVGKDLYGTISERLHNHKEYRDKEVDADVLRMVHAILPAAYSSPTSTEKERDWSIVTEKKRWGLT
ncbi:hypothetical protein SLS60_011305 [Paraconiothyrium brasiliense]|uniref:Uncharacterized protein n=1 Tax=Paraconiothyrium brasiliense TaxID=300254 RepID=A0ABR3QJI7_9PLEO